MEPNQQTDAGPGDAEADLSKDLLGMRIVGGTLIAGSLTFLGMMLLVGGFKNEPFADAGVISWLGIGMAVAMLVLSYIVPSMSQKAQLDQLSMRDNVPATDYAGIYRAKMIIGQAMVEGAAFFNVIAYFVEGQLMNLGVVLLLVARIAVQIPSEGSLRRWIRDEMQMTGTGQ